MTTILPWTNSIQYEGDLSKDDMDLRNSVVEEYLFDRNWVNACKRLGMNSQLAFEYATRFASDSYVQKRLKERELASVDTPETNSKKELEKKRQRIIQGLEEESNYHGPGSSHAARVSAFKQLCAIYGFEAPKQQKVELGVSSGVMLVPMGGSMEDWEKAASESQTKLQEDTMNGLDTDTVH